MNLWVKSKEEISRPFSKQLTWEHMLRRKYKYPYHHVIMWVYLYTQRHKNHQKYWPIMSSNVSVTTVKHFKVSVFFPKPSVALLKLQNSPDMLIQDFGFLFLVLYQANK